MNTNSPSKQTKVRRTAEQWQNILLAYEESGLSQEAFCTQQSIATSTFHKWRQRLAADQQVVPEFIELASPSQPVNSGGWDIELSLSDTVVLRIRQLN